jgi:hypothetical protein
MTRGSPLPQPRYLPSSTPKLASSPVCHNNLTWFFLARTHPHHLQCLCFVLGEAELVRLHRFGAAAEVRVGPTYYNSVEYCNRQKDSKKIRKRFENTSNTKSKRFEKTSDTKSTSKSADDDVKTNEEPRMDKFSHT